MRISDWSSDVCSSDLMSSWPPPFDAILVNTQACMPLQCNGSGGQIGFELITAECADRHTSVHAPMTFHGAGLHIDVHVARGEAIALGRLELHGSGTRALTTLHVVAALLRSQDGRTVVAPDAGDHVIHLYECLP